MALLSIFRGTQAECSARPVSDGTLLFATDIKKIYLDKDSSRIEMSSVDDLSDYVTKEQLTTALDGKANKADIDALIKSLTDRVAALEKIRFQTKSVTPSTTAQTITADTGYDALSSVSVAPIPYTETDNSTGGKTATIAGV